MDWVTCIACRLAQPPAPRCAACGEPEPATWFQRPTALFARDIASGWLRRLGRARLRPKARPTERMRGPALLRGTARPLEASDGPTTVESFVTRRPCLATTLRLVDDDGALYVWLGRAAPFDVVAPSGQRLRLEGRLRVDGLARQATRIADEYKRRWLEALEPARRLPGTLEELTVRAGDVVEAYGAADTMIVADGYRQQHEQPTARPLPGQPVVVALITRQP